MPNSIGIPPVAAPTRSERLYHDRRRDRPTTAGGRSFQDLVDAFAAPEETLDDSVPRHDDPGFPPIGAEPGGEADGSAFGDPDLDDPGLDDRTGGRQTTLCALPHDPLERIAAATESMLVLLLRIDQRLSSLEKTVAGSDVRPTRSHHALDIEA